MIIVINTHSFIDIITNSSMETFVLDTERSLDFVDNIIRMRIEEIKDDCFYAEKWLNTEYSISINESGKIEIFSWLNMPEEISDLLINIFNGECK